MTLRSCLTEGENTRVLRASGGQQSLQGLGDGRGTQGARGRRSRLGYPAVLQCRVVFRSRWARDVSVDGPHSSAGKLVGWRGPRLPGRLLWWHGGQGPATLFHAGLQVRASLCLGARGPRWQERNQRELLFL